MGAVRPQAPDFLSFSSERKEAKNAAAVPASLGKRFAVRAESLELAFAALRLQTARLSTARSARLPGSPAKAERCYHDVKVLSGKRGANNPFPFKLYTLYFNLSPIAVRRRCVRHRRCCVRRRSLRSGLRPMNGWASRTNSCWASRTNGSGCSCCAAQWMTTSGWAS